VAVVRCKSWIGTPEGRKWVDKEVVGMLKRRQAVNKGRNYTKLNASAKQTVKRGSVSDKFFTRLICDPTLSLVTPRTLEENRYQWSTLANSTTYSNELIEALDDIGAVERDSEDKIVKLDLSRVITSDECPLVLGATDRGGKGNKVLTAKGVPAVKHVQVNKQRVSYDPYVTIDGKWLLHHIIIALKHFHFGGAFS
jgi:hypothetical protein